MQESKIGLLKKTYTEWSSHNALRLAAAMALYVMMALAPLLVVALTILTLTHQGKAADLSAQATKYVGQQGAEAINQILSTSTQQKKGGLIAAIVGFVIALISASGLFVSLQDAINTIWDVKPKPDAGWRAMVWSRLISVGVIFAAGAILLASFVVSAVLSIIVRQLPGWLSWVSIIGDIVISLGVITALFAMIYKFLPDVKIDWKDVWLGGALTAVIFVVGKYGLTLYFKYAAVASPYGTAGSLAALLIWIYYSAAIVFFGAEFTRVYTESRGKEIVPDKFAMKLSTADRAKRGEPHPDELDHAQAQQEKGVGQNPQPYGKARDGKSAMHHAPAQSNGRSRVLRYAVAGAGVAVGALAGGLGAWGMTSEERRMRVRLRELSANERLREAEREMRRASHLHDLLERINVNERIDAVREEMRQVAQRTTRRPPAASLTQRLARAVADNW